jgi:hypothetical protein
MKRSDLLKAAPLGAIAALGGAPLLGSAGRESRVLAQATATPDPCQRWKFPSLPLGKDGGHGFAEAWHRPDCNTDWAIVGGAYLDILVNKGGGFQYDKLTFTNGNTKSQEFTLTELPAIFHSNSLIQIFKDWYYQVDGSGRGGTLYNGNPGSGGVAMGYGTTDSQFQNSTFTMLPTSGGSAGSCTVPWGQGPLVLPGDIGICIAACAAWAVCAVIVIATFIGGIAGPAEWIVFAGVCVGLVALSQLVLESCK